MNTQRLATGALLALLLLGTSAFALDLPVVIQQLENGTSAERRAAVQAIVSDPPASYESLVQPLATAASDPEEETRYFAVIMLATIGRLSAEDAARLGGVATELVALLADPSPRVRAPAAAALGLTSPNTPVAARDGLMALLADPDASVRTVSAVALLRLENLADIERDAVLDLILNDSSANVRNSVLGALSAIPVGESASVDAVTSALSDSDASVRLNAANAIAAFGGSARTALDELTAIAEGDPNADVRLVARQAIATIEAANAPPDCSQAVAVPSLFWPPNHKMVEMEFGGLSDPDGDEISISVLGVTQDERVDEPGSGNSCPDASFGEGVPTLVRSERSGRLDGRVYRVRFNASDPTGESCTGTVIVCMPHDQSSTPTCVEQPEEYDSTDCS